MNFGKNQLKRCKYGWMLFEGPFIGKCFELYGQYSEAEVEVIKAFARPGGVAIDIGANIGDLTLPMALVVGEAGRVYAVESNPRIYHILCANLALNEIQNTKAINAFVADSVNVDTSGPWGKFAYVSERWETQFIAIDSLGLEVCDFIKIDVDGKELEVLRSAENTIEAARPVIYFENDDPSRSAELLDHLLSRGYEIFWHPAPIFSPDNFFGNPVNHWPNSIISQMMLALPVEHPAIPSVRLRKVTHAGQWWDAL